ncbi:MAG: hypothetical protein WA108_03470 [Thiobacillus sp.]
MKKYLVGVGLLLSVNGVLGDDSGLEQSMKNMLTSAKEKQMASALKSPQAFQGAGPLLLRDAIYLYNLPVYAGNLQLLIGIGCDIFQLVMDVENGYADLAIGEGINSGGYFAGYPDRIYANAAMFSYALYSGYSDKSFGFTDLQLYGAAGVDPNTVIGHATGFGYCFSTNPDAAVFSCDEENCYSSSEVNH